MLWQLCSSFSFAQQADKLIKKKEAERIIKTLAADEMQGRKVFTPGIEKAADFIAGEFKKAGLLPFPDLENYKQTFTVVKSTMISAEGMINELPVDPKNIIAITSKTELQFNEKSGFNVVVFDSTVNLRKEASALLKANQNYLVLADSSLAADFYKLKRF